jgi:hypothetical protein
MSAIMTWVLGFAVGIGIGAFGMWMKTRDRNEQIHSIYKKIR